MEVYILYVYIGKGCMYILFTGHVALPPDSVSKP